MRNQHQAHLRLSSIALLGILLGVNGCSSGKYDTDLQEYVAQVLARPGQSIAAISILNYDNHFTYTRQNVRGPFKPYSLNARLMPDFKRPKEALEAFPIDGLHMVGVITRNNKIWAIIRAPDDTVHYISFGGHLGQNFGKVTAINADEIKVMEFTANGSGGWEQHGTSINLEETLTQTAA